MSHDENIMYHTHLKIYWKTWQKGNVMKNTIQIACDAVSLLIQEDFKE